jgi:hypothetical protein
MGAFARKGDSGGGADATAATGDQNILSFKAVHDVPSVVSLMIYGVFNPAAELMKQLFGD